MIHEVDTEYQYARVIERDDGTRVLELNEGQAEHSLYRPGTVLTGDYWDGHLVLAVRRPRPAAAARRDPRQRRRHDRARVRGAVPAHRVDAVEIDGELSEIGRRYFDMTDPRLTLHHEDARPFLRRTDGALRRDHRSTPTASPTSRSTSRRRSSSSSAATGSPGGVVLINVGHPEGQDELEKVLAATMGEVFPHVLRDPVEDTNTLLVASERADVGGAPARRGGDAARCAPPIALAAAAPARRRRCAAATSTPTTRRRSSG